PPATSTSSSTSQTNSRAASTRTPEPQNASDVLYPAGAAFAPERTELSDAVLPHRRMHRKTRQTYSVLEAPLLRRSGQSCLTLFAPWRNFHPLNLAPPENPFTSQTHLNFLYYQQNLPKIARIVLARLLPWNRPGEALRRFSKKEITCHRHLKSLRTASTPSTPPGPSPPKAKPPPAAMP